jgi:uncharacterized protein (TIGR00369 family)
MSNLRHRTIEWADPMISVAAAEGKTGLELLRAIVAGEVPQAPIGASLGFVIEAADEGLARFRGVPAEYQYNPMGSVHGGWACTLLDSAMGCAVMSTLDADSAYTTAQLGIHLTRAITVKTGPVVCEARIVSRGARVATAEGRLVDAGGALLAHGTTTCVIVPRRRAA